MLIRYSKDQLDTLHPIDLYTARAQWLTLLSALHKGQAFLITRRGQPFAQLTPIAPSESFPVPMLDPDTAQRIYALAHAYQTPTLASLLGISEFRMQTLLDTGLADEGLFEVLTELEALAQILFAKGKFAAGRRWLMRPHPKLRHHPPLFALRRSLSGDSDMTTKIMHLAQVDFPTQSVMPHTEPPN